MSDRKTEILDAVDSMLTAHDEWVLNDSEKYITDRMELVFDRAVLVVTKGGDIPRGCVQLMISVSIWAVEWAAYKRGNWDSQRRPRGEFWDRFNAIRIERQGIQQFAARTIESVRQLRHEKLTDLQIARAYGKRINEDLWIGPFFDARGGTRFDLIQKEHDTPGSVIPAGWIHPNDEDTLAANLKELEGRLKAVPIPENSSSAEDPASIEELLREGAFPAQIARVKKTTLDHVYEVAKTLGLTPNELPNLGAMRAPGENQITPEQDAALQPGKQHQQQPKPFQAEETPETSKADDESIRQAIFEAADDNPNMGSPEIAEIVTTETGVKVSAQKVAGVLRHRKQVAGA